MTLLLSIALICVGITTIADANNIVIKNQPDTEEWWLAFYILNEDISCGGQITNVEIKDNFNYPVWKSYSRHQWVFYEFFHENLKFTTPISIRITREENPADPEIITSLHIITSFTGNAEFDFGFNFCSGLTDSPTKSPTNPPTKSPTNPPTKSPTNPPTKSPNNIPSETICVEASPANFLWTSQQHKIKLNGDIFALKGISWFGADGDGYVVAGLATWYGNGGHSYLWYFDLLSNLGFNAIRLCFSQHGVLNNPLIPNWAMSTAGNEIFDGKRFFEGLDIIINEAAQRGILIMLDCHSIFVNQGGTDRFNDTNNNGITVWNMMADRYNDRWNVFMIDVFNEPWDVRNHQWAVYKNWAQTVGNNLIDIYGTNWLIGVQGTNPACFNRAYERLPLADDNWCYWGENLQFVDVDPVVLNENNRVVYIPHVYGPSLTEHSNLDPIAYSPDIWYDHWAYIHTSNVVDSAVMPGEWGSSYSTPSRKLWMDTFVDYLISIELRNNFFWCLNANSADTGGILASDWDTLESGKITKLNELQPNPTLFTYDSGTNTVCWDLPDI